MEVTLQLSATKVDKKDWGPFAKSDPYFTLSRKNEAGKVVQVHRSETCMHTLDPSWKPFKISGIKLCRGDEDYPVKLEVCIGVCLCLCVVSSTPACSYCRRR